MTRAKSKFELDFTHGSLIKKMAMFALPLMATSILQLLFNAADMIVVSLESDTAMGSIGATTSLVNILLQFTNGLAIGAGVIMSRAFGAKDEGYAGKVLHTAMLIGLLSGIAVAIVGLLFSEQALVLMKTPENNLVLATQYLIIYFLGSPFNLVYGFGAAMLRSVGDTRRPLVYLTIAGFLNLAINLVTVLVFHMGVVGVALATIASQAASAVLVVIALFKSQGFVKLRIKQLRFTKKAFFEILRIGVPSGIQGAIFSLSNIFIQTAINTFDTTYVNGNSAAANIEGFVYMAMWSVSSAAITSTGQNYGAKDFRRIKSSVFTGMVLSTAVELVLGALVLVCFKPIVGLYVSDPVSAAVALERSLILITTNWMCGIMEVIGGTLRGMGYSVVPTVLMIIGTCLVRLAWIVFVFPIIGTYSSIFLIFPISWGLTALLLGVMLVFCFRKQLKQHENQSACLEKIA